MAEVGAGAPVIVSVYNSDSCPDELKEDLEFVRDIIFDETTGKIKRKLTKKTIGIMRATFRDGTKQKIVAISGPGADEWTGKPVKIGNEQVEPVASRLQKDRTDIAWAELTYKHDEYTRLQPGEKISLEDRKAFSTEFIMRLEDKVEGLKEANQNRKELVNALELAGHGQGRTKEDFDDLVSYYERFSQDDELFKSVCKVMKAYFEEPDPVKYCQSQAIPYLGDAMLSKMQAKIKENFVEVVQAVVKRHLDTACVQDRALCCIPFYEALGLLDSPFVDMKAASDSVEYCRTEATRLLGDEAFEQIETRIKSDGVACAVVEGAVGTVHLEARDKCCIFVCIALGIMDPDAVTEVPECVKYAMSVSQEPLYHPLDERQTKAVCLLGEAVLSEIETRTGRDGVKDRVKIVKDVVAKYSEPLEVREMWCILIQIALGIMGPNTFIDIEAPDPVKYCRARATFLIGLSAYNEIETKMRREGVEIVQDVVERYTTPVGVNMLCYTLIYIAFGITNPAMFIAIKTPDWAKHCKTRAARFLGEAVFKKIGARIKEGEKEVVQDVFSEHIVPRKVDMEGLILIYIALGLIDPTQLSTLADIKTSDPVEYCQTRVTSLLGDAGFRELEDKIREGQKKVAQDVFARYLKPLGIPEEDFTIIGIALGVKDPPGTTTLANITARCAEDNALECLRKLKNELKETKGPVTQIEWFSAILDLSEQSCPLKHKPLCPFCAVAFVPRAEKINEI